MKDIFYLHQGAYVIPGIYLLVYLYSKTYANMQYRLALLHQVNKFT